MTLLSPSPERPLTLDPRGPLTNFHNKCPPIRPNQSISSFTSSPIPFSVVWIKYWKMKKKKVGSGVGSRIRSQVGSHLCMIINFYGFYTYFAFTGAILDGIDPLLGWTGKGPTIRVEQINSQSLEDQRRSKFHWTVLPAVDRNASERRKWDWKSKKPNLYVTMLLCILIWFLDA